MKNFKPFGLIALAGASIWACRPNYPIPQVNQATIAPLARTNANNARIMVFNALVDFNPDPINGPNAFFTILVDGQELPNLNGTKSVIYSNNFYLDASNTVVPLSRKYPQAANFAGIAGAVEQSSVYEGIAFTGTPPPGFNTATAFTNFAQAVPANVINGVEVTPAQQEIGIFIPAGRRNITFNNALGEPATTRFRVNTNLNAGSITSIFLRGVTGTTSGTAAEGATIITETLPTIPAGQTAIRFLNFASDLGDVHMLTVGTSAPAPLNVDRRPILAFPNPPSGTRFTADQGATPGDLIILQANRDSLASRSRYIPAPTAANPYAFINRTYNSNNFSFIAIERNSDGQPIPNYTFSVPVTNYTFRASGTYTFNFFYPNRRHQAPVLSKNVTFNFLAGRAYTVVLHGNSSKGYKCDIIRMN